MSVYQYRGFIKDQLSLNSLPKANVIITSCTLKGDLLKTAKATLKVLEMPSNLNEGDLLVVYDIYGYVIYKGIIQTFEESTITCNQIQGFYKGTWIYEQSPSTSIEKEYATLLTKYAQGYTKGQTTYQDILMNQEKEPLLIKYVESDEAVLPSESDNKTYDMEKFIYKLYENYGIVLQFVIPNKSWDIGDENGGKVIITKPSEKIIKVSSNTQCITNIDATSEVESCNNLVIYSKDGVYRTTYVMTSFGAVEQPSSISGRIGQINTKVVFSDDDIDTIVEANLSTLLYNHKVEFTMILDNNLYDFYNWELGQPIQIYYNGNYYNSVFTGYELTKNENQMPTSVKIICGKVRNTLTDKLNVFEV